MEKIPSVRKESLVEKANPNSIGEPLSIGKDLPTSPDKVYRSVTRQISILVLAVIAIVLAGIMLGFLYNRLPANNPQESRAGCESVGGEWDQVENKCLVSYKEAGEQCTDGGQCKSGVCSPPILSSEEALLARGPITGIVGVCASDTEVIGCVPQVVKGVITAESMCME